MIFNFLARRKWLRQQRAKKWKYDTALVRWQNTNEYVGKVWNDIEATMLSPKPTEKEREVVKQKLENLREFVRTIFFEIEACRERDKAWDDLMNHWEE